MDGEVHNEELNVAFADRTALPSPRNGFFARITRTFMYGKDGSGPSPIALRITMPLVENDLSGITSVGGLMKSNVKHVSRREDEKERLGQGLQISSPLLNL
jgi:hypothetical protein